MRRLLARPIDWPGASIETVGDLLAMSGCYGCVIALAVMLTIPALSA